MESKKTVQRTNLVPGVSTGNQSNCKAGKFRQNKNYKPESNTSKAAENSNCNVNEANKTKSCPYYEDLFNSTNSEGRITKLI